MAVSVRLDPLLEKQLELFAKRQGITKSQFIVTAIERALGRRDPYKLLVEVHAKHNDEPARPAIEDEDLSPHKAAVRAHVRARHVRIQTDWLAHQEAQKNGKTWVPDVGAAA